MVTVKKFIRQVHLWLGLATGLIVIVISLTGCIYAFKVEIEEAIQPFLFVNTENRPMLVPSVLRKIAENQLPGKHTHSIIYKGKERSVQVVFYQEDPKYYFITYLNPYSGKVLEVKNMDEDFFRFILDGHFYLWLPPDVGQIVVSSATLIFVIMLITGIILWWPSNKNAVQQRFTIKWNSKWRRVNYDLHSVLGFYGSWIVIFIAFTGLVWGFQWFAGGTYFIFSGGKKMAPYAEPLSQPTGKILSHVEDKAFFLMEKKYPQASSIEVHFPDSDSVTIACNANPDLYTYWKTDYVYFDQKTLEEKEVGHAWGKLQNAILADKVMRMNYDIHVGAISGLPGKCIAFFASLISASLPVTGFYMWWGRMKKKLGTKNYSKTNHLTKVH